MIATAPTTIPVVEHTYTTVLTPKGEAVVQLIRANWLSDYASPQVRNERFADIVAPLNLSSEDVADVAALWAATYQRPED